MNFVNTMVFSSLRMRMWKSCTCEFKSEVCRILFRKVLKKFNCRNYYARAFQPHYTKFYKWIHYHYGFIRVSYFSTEFQCISFYKWNTYISPHFLEVCQVFLIFMWYFMEVLYCKVCLRLYCALYNCLFKVLCWY